MKLLEQKTYARRTLIYSLSLTYHVKKKIILVCIFVCEVEAYTIRPLLVGFVFIKFGLSFKKKMIIHLTACIFV